MQTQKTAPYFPGVILFEEDSQRIAELERSAIQHGADPGIRRELAAVLYRRAVEACSVTRDGTMVMASERQRRLCADAARRILELGVDDADLLWRARSLREAVADGDRWVWLSRGPAAALLTIAVIGGFGLVWWSMTAGSMLLAVASALAGSALAAAVVLRFRKQRWRLEARRAGPIIARHGL